MGCKLPSCMPPEELSSIKMFNIDNVEENSDYNQETKDEYEPPKKKIKKNKEKKPKSLDLKLDHESDSEKKNYTPTVSISIILYIILVDYWTFST